jgi:hypothetical protein
MTVIAYETPEGAPESITEPVDTLSCELNVCCDRARPAAVGWHLIEDPDTGRGGVVWALTYTLQADDEDAPVLSCEDCLGWLQDALGVATTDAPETPA